MGEKYTKQTENHLSGADCRTEGGVSVNFVFLSPYFPVNYYRFCVALKRAGANVLAIGDLPYDQLRNELKDVLTEYYRVDDLHLFDQLRDACGHFVRKYGPINGLESHNEYWMETDARLRSEFDIPGVRQSQIGLFKSKLRMKETFAEAGIAVAAGTSVFNQDQAEQFCAAHGYPVILKPDVGVGAVDTYRVDTAAELAAFFAVPRPQAYIIEQFIDGRIETFDGLVDASGGIVFYTSHIYQYGIMEIIRDNLNAAFHSLRQLPDDLTEAGQRALAAFGLRARFFHLEFFRRPDGSLIGLEANMRPPGGPILDMFNFANDFDIYQEWANMVVQGRFNKHLYNPQCRKYFCGFAGRKFNRSYALSHEALLSRYGRFIAAHESLPPLYSTSMGDYFYLIRSEDLSDVQEVTQAVSQTVADGQQN